MFRALWYICVVTVVSAGTLYFEPHHEAPIRDIICKDRKSSCPSDATCCQATTGEYACCPMKDVSYTPLQLYLGASYAVPVMGNNDIQQRKHVYHNAVEPGQSNHPLK